MKRKINVFLGGFTNYTNAQNLNCRAVALHLDKQKFHVYTLALAEGQLPSLKGLDGITVFRCFRPLAVSMRLGFCWGICRCDVAYLPKSELWRFNKFLLQLLRKPCFSTMEGIIDADARQSITARIGDFDQYLKSRSFFDKHYSITAFIREYNQKAIGLASDDVVLSLGVDSQQFKNNTQRGVLRKAVLIGNDLLRKGIFDYLEIAAKFPAISFVIAGSGNGKIDVQQLIRERALLNVTYIGMVNTGQLAGLLAGADLHILPSRSEGFPKVILEAAAAGVPSVVYDDYGAQQWIEHGKNGWVVQTIADMIEIVALLSANPDLLRNASNQAVQLADTFDWKLQIGSWEQLIEDIVKTR